MKKITYKKVLYPRNIELNIDPYCYECDSHTKDKDGYHRFQRDGFNKMHRWIHWKITGEKPRVVMHKCDNPACINPAHLKSGTCKDNSLDRDNKGRASKVGNRGNIRGLKNPNSKLTEQDVKLIKIRIQSGHRPIDIARTFNVSKSTISNIKFNRSWDYINTK